MALVVELLKLVAWVASAFYVCAFFALRQLHRRPATGDAGTLQRRVHLFHLTADAGGGGEKCLWAVVQAFAQQCDTPTQLNLYTHAQVPHVLTLFQKAARDFGIEIAAFGGDRFTTNVRPHLRVCVRPLRTATLVSHRWPVCQHLGELLAGVLVGAEAAFKATGSARDEIWDTQGLAATVCTYSLMTSLLSRPLHAYVHWPWVNSHTFTELRETQCSRRSLYHTCVSQIYRALGSFYSRPVCVNSTFTETRLAKAWRLCVPADVVKVLPPVDRHLTRFAGCPKEELVLSIAQFRPEKNHVQQVRSIARLLHKHKVASTTRFCICGSLSRPEDRDLSISLYELARDCCGPHSSVTYTDHETGDRRGFSDVKSNQPLVEFHVNVPDKELTQMKSVAKVGFHTMKEEHFGIAVVDLLLAGAVIVAHRSGGPLLDILHAPTEEEMNCEGGFKVATAAGMELGLLAETDDEFADKLHEALQPTSDTKQRLQLAQAVATNRFLSSVDFGTKVLRVWQQSEQKKSK
eukprot:Gregarina_sp_Pseudo_9__178@NODE_1118_length_1862_cov_27_766868_g1045_i0_p1_GENE_NODE_1118_length_1862_cov_27_766868_g1045_i0NODE_1118_length_1862_cov_27_766868_g1045_i0_p1_ORF_typecomplete_len540_score162_69ALG11_N/PF15924_5/3_2e26Glycos_transf_1/PF00534_20/3_4e13Glyco_trans_1_4/PF13692_6/2e06_NODE_1118_length_1862_cov_27_766868_g1045_i0651621